MRVAHFAAEITPSANADGTDQARDNYRTDITYGKRQMARFARYAKNARFDSVSCINGTIGKIVRLNSGLLTRA